MSNEACKTPVEDLLRAIPRELVIQYETDSNGWKVGHNCPIGRDAHEAADTILALRAENQILREGMKGDYNLDAWLDWVAQSKAGSTLPASSGPEQPKCKTCDDMGVLVEKNTPYPGAETCRGICPDCAKDRAERCPDCGRPKARSADDCVAGHCPKWYAVRDADAADDCVDFQPGGKFHGMTPAQARAATTPTKEGQQ